MSSDSENPQDVQAPSNIGARLGPSLGLLEGEPETKKLTSQSILALMYAYRLGSILICLLILGLFGFMFFGNDLTQWWNHWQLQREYVERLTLEEGDLIFKAGGGNIRDDGGLQLIVVIDHQLGGMRVGGIDDSLYAVDWDIAIVVEGQRVQEVQFSGSPLIMLAWGSSRQPVRTWDEFITQKAELHLTLRQGEKLILEHVGPLEELRLEDLSGDGLLRYRGVELDGAAVQFSFP